MTPKVGDTAYLVYYEMDRKLHLYEVELLFIDPNGRWYVKTPYGEHSIDPEMLGGTPWQAIFAKQKEIRQKILSLKMDLSALGSLEIEK